MVNAYGICWCPTCWSPVTPQNWEDTVDDWNPAPPGMYETLLIIEIYIHLPYQLVSRISAINEPYDRYDTPQYPRHTRLIEPRKRDSWANSYTCETTGYGGGGCCPKVSSNDPFNLGESGIKMSWNAPPTKKTKKNGHQTSRIPISWKEIWNSFSRRSFFSNSSSVVDAVSYTELIMVLKAISSCRSGFPDMKRWPMAPCFQHLLNIGDLENL